MHVRETVMKFKQELFSEPIPLIKRDSPIQFLALIICKTVCIKGFFAGYFSLNHPNPS